jgi:hypothetical protein
MIAAIHRSSLICMCQNKRRKYNLDYPICKQLWKVWEKCIRGANVKVEMLLLRSLTASPPIAIGAIGHQESTIGSLIF